MPWVTPTRKAIRILVRDEVKAKARGADATIPNSVLRVLSDVTAAVCHSTLEYVDWLAKQLLPDTAEREWLDRHARMWLTNADGSRGRKLATLAEGTVTMTGQAWTQVPKGTRFNNTARAEYETTEAAFISGGAPTPVKVRALDPGSIGNLDPGATMSLAPPIIGVEGQPVVVTMDGGVDDETDDELRARVLLRIQQPPQGGAKVDYEEWALGVPGVTRAWCAPVEMGLGTVTVRFMCDDLRAAQGGFPHGSDIARVTTEIDRKRPVTVKDFFVVAPIRHPVDVTINRLQPDTPSIRAAIEASLKTMIADRARPGGQIFASWKSGAVLNTAGVVSFALGNTADDLMPSPGHMAVLGNTLFTAQ